MKTCTVTWLRMPTETFNRISFILCFKLHRKWWIRLSRKVPFTLTKYISFSSITLNFSHKSQRFITHLKLSSKRYSRHWRTPDSTFFFFRHGTVLSSRLQQYVTRQKALLHMRNVFIKLSESLWKCKRLKNLVEPLFKTHYFFLNKLNKFYCHQKLYLNIYSFKNTLFIQGHLVFSPAVALKWKKQKKKTRQI